MTRPASKAKPIERRLTFRTGTRVIELDFHVRLLAVSDSSHSDEPTTARTFTLESIVKVIVTGSDDHPELVLTLDSGERVSLGTIQGRDRALRAAWALGNALRCIIEQESPTVIPAGDVTDEFPSFATQDVEEETDRFEIPTEIPSHVDDELNDTVTTGEIQFDRARLEAALRSQSGSWAQRKPSAPRNMPNELPWLDALAPAPIDLSDLESAELVVDERKRNTWIVRTKRGDRVTIPFTPNELQEQSRRASSVSSPPRHPPAPAAVVVPVRDLFLRRPVDESMEVTQPPDLDRLYEGEDTGH